MFRLFFVLLASLLLAAPAFSKSSPSSNLLPSGSVSGLYNRKDWPHWLDIDRDCQNTRVEVLIRYSLTPVGFKNARQCALVSGRWYGLYTDKTFTKPGKIDIDHIVPLKWANGHGGSAWSRARKRAFANDMDNLLPVDAAANRSKGDKGPDEWMPPRHEYRCEYLGRFTAIVAKYQLSYAPSEKRVIARMLKACGA